MDLGVRRQALRLSVVGMAADVGREIVKREQDAPDGVVLYVAWFDSAAWMEVYLGEGGGRSPRATTAVATARS